MKRTKGFSVVELMIALLIGSFLVLGLVQVFTANKKAFSMQEASSRIQENGRMAIEMLSRDIRSAGYMGCVGMMSGKNVSVSADLESLAKKTGASLSMLQALVKEAAGSLDTNQLIEHYNDVNDPLSAASWPSALEAYGLKKAEVWPKTDVLVLKGAEPCPGGRVIQVNGAAAAGGTAQVKIEDAQACGLKKHDLVILANCTNADIFGITNEVAKSSDTSSSGGGADKDTLAHGADINISPKLAGSYDTDSYIYRYRVRIFYIGKGEDGEPSLYLSQLTTTSEAAPMETLELARGVEDLQVLLGVDEDGNEVADRYVTESASMDKVVAMKVNLLVRSEADVLGSTEQSYFFALEKGSPADDKSRLRLPFQATVTLRNRVD